MGLHVKFRVLACALVIGLVSGCGATIRQHVTVNRSVNSESFASLGDVVVRVDVREDLPNLYGRADVFGRTRDRGFSDLRYMGLSPEGFAVFRRRDVDIQTNETTMNAMGFGTAVVTAQRSGSGIVGTGIYTRAPAPNIQALPPDTIEFALDLRQGNIITIRERTVEVLEATASGVRFVIR